MIKLDIFSDPVCPWCYIGKANLDRALESAPDHPFEIEWHPFQLNPGMPPEGVDRAAYLEAKFGGKAKAVEIYARVEQAARDAGLAIDFSTISKMPNSLNAHRLIHWAGLEGRQTAIVSALFRAYWREGRDINDASTLADIAEAAGMDRALTTRLLATDEDSEALKARDIHARQKGVAGVPCFIIGNQYVISGAQAPQVWAEVIAELRGHAQTTGS
ncbi:MAG: DsbA family oxidoreductase [Pseudotabrizicola sp.]|uniref:DsbA family oxidoreductase n=1 Tax=Pseudotabrizicola sp. TaxID=2939647 RepID=UPI00271BD859|nr:DsbA family oxidoreductase [Pseudotabrizicola sp.]MDO8882154.1 DsbA family oxidoreductase [Pseudotabrizicola sp.]MDP2082669.1 DsbA family oxidoreductase [Pseudotabrizicola sp.]MDZ7573565.1 DsbA family oxidoreductase [Pseudotabrizicola sp.]